MSDNDNSMISYGDSIEEAIEAGLKSLGISRDEAEIKVIEEGSKGLFGIGSKEAAVLITALEEEDNAMPASQQASPAYASSEDEAEDPDESDSLEAEETGEDQEEIVSITRDTVVELLAKMHVQADVSAKMSPMDPHSSRKAVSVDITGEDLSILIGRKAETLDALQYITRLIVGKELSSSVIINIDVQGYKKRREQRLRRIAKSVARQAVETGRRQYLEPMSAADRRIVHMTLRSNPNVYTESVGEGFRRKVTINPKE